MIYTNEKIDFTKEPMFFGKGRNIQRYDTQKYHFFEKAAIKQMKLYWQPEEITLVKDVLDYKNLHPHEKHIYERNLAYQILLDSVQGRSPILTFGRITTLPELEQVTIIWNFYEMIHSRSYSHILRNLLSDCNKFFDSVLEDENIKTRANSVTKYYNELYTLINQYENGAELTETFMFKIKKATYLSLVAVNILEGIRFYVSFACSFAFAENQKMVGNAKIIKLIARDEIEHLSVTQKMINILRKEPSEGFIDVIESCNDEVDQMYIDAVNEECDWADYLFQNGSIMGLNADLLKQYMRQLTNKRKIAIGYKPSFAKEEDPLPWMHNWLNSSGVETQLQESENTSYLLASIDMNNVCDDDYSFKD